MILRKVLFWLVWIPAAPILFLYYYSGRRSSTYYRINLPATKTKLVRFSVWERLVIRKAETRDTLLAEQRLRNFNRKNPYTTRNRPYYRPDSRK